LKNLKQCLNWKYFDFFVVIIFSVFVVLAIRYQIKLLDYLVFGDEAETIVAAKMMVSGQKLYSEIFNHHGPLTFLPGMLLELFGDFGVSAHRVPIAIFQILAVASIYFSPLLNDAFTRKAYAITISSVILLFFPELFGSMYMYQVMAGLIIIVVLAQYTLPTICSPEKVSTRNVFLGNTLIACLPFLAITYAPIAFLLFASSLRKKYLAKSSIYLAGAILANIAFLACIGSIAGFFAFHIYLNSEILPLYNSGQTGVNLIKNAFNASTESLANFSFFILIVAVISRLSSAENGFPWRSLLLAAGFASLLIRGLGFHALPYYYSLMAIPLVFFSGRSNIPRQSQLATTLLIIVCVIKLSLLIPGDKEKLESSKIPLSTEFSRLVQELTDKNDRIIAYSFNNQEYIASHRLPASGNFFYLPWQEKYNESPKFGIKIDACKEISEYQPKIMLIDKWKAFDTFSWESYGGCIQKLLDKDYTQYPGRPYYLRKDVAEAFFKRSEIIATKMQPSAQLNFSAPIKLYTAIKNNKTETKPKRIGVMFATYTKKNPGEAELRLKRLDGPDLIRRFPLPDLADNQYHYFDIDSIYTEGEIVSISGDGISTWESHDENGGIHTCIIYEYIDGKKIYTPGCP
ncbi:hypothetical protein, partial [Pseudomonas sp. MPBD4-3]|uniref:hypothetical protein n=1 Tax=Pseudomonas sp. MPBD4-3 TaxID=2070575 RepID=UPI001304C1B0